MTDGADARPGPAELEAPFFSVSGCALYRSESPSYASSETFSQETFT